MARYNSLIDKIQSKSFFQRPDQGAINRARRFDYNNYERVINDVTGRVSSSPSQRLAIAQGLGLQTQGLIIGGQRDGGGGSRYGVSSFAPSSEGTYTNAGSAPAANVISLSDQFQAALMRRRSQAGRLRAAVEQSNNERRSKNNSGITQPPPI